VSQGWAWQISWFTVSLVQELQRVRRRHASAGGPFELRGCVVVTHQPREVESAAGCLGRARAWRRMAMAARRAVVAAASSGFKTERQTIRRGGARASHGEPAEAAQLRRGGAPRSPPAPPAAARGTLCSRAPPGLRVLRHGAVELPRKATQGRVDDTANLLQMIWPAHLRSDG
jgi:hypothetical protein